MTSKERFVKILQREAVDRPSCICPGGMMNMITTGLMDLSGISLPEAHTDSAKMAALAKSSYTEHCFDNVGVPFCMTVEAEALGARVDLGNRIYEPHVIEYPMNSVTDYGMLSPISLNSGRVKVVLDAIRLLKEDSEKEGFPIVGNLVGPISVASSLIEPVAYYKELRKKKEAAHAFMQFVTEQLIEFGRAQLDAGADIITIAEPSGTGEILGPKYFEEFAVHYLNVLLEGLREGREKKVHTVVHICGQMRSVYEKLSHVNSDVLSFDAVVSLKEAGASLPDHILMGNVSTYTLEFGEPEKVKSLTRNCCRNGSRIVAPACGLGMASPLSNIQAILAGLEEIG